MTTKRRNPYDIAVQEAREYVLAVQTVERRLMWFYAKDKLSEGWALHDLAQRTAAADTLGYDVVLKNTERGLEVLYVKRPRNPPLRFL